jgi:electron transfer flavoprotein alpha subunit
MSRYLVLAEHRKGALRDISLETLAAAGRLGGEALGAVLPGGDGGIAEDLARHCPRVLHIDDDAHEHYEPAVRAAALAAAVSREGADALVLPHSYHGMDLAGRLAALLGWPLVTDVTGLALDCGRITATRMVFGGRVESRVALPAGSPALITVRPTAFPAAEPLGSPGVVEPTPSAHQVTGRTVRFLELVEEAAEGEDITQADVVVAVGRGVGEQENIEMVAELAQALGGVLACSRPIVDRGWLPRSRQVGTSGRTIRPKVYVAVGISGAFQHVAGMKGAGRVIAVNRDPHAPIFQSADYGIVGDLFQIVPELTRSARERKQ